MGVIKKTGVTIAAVLLVVGVVIGAVVISKSNGSNAAPETTNAASSPAPTTTSSKTVSAICEPTQHKDACVQSMQSVKPDASIKDYLEAAVKATIAEVRKAINATNEVVVDNDGDKDGIHGCNDFLSQTVDQLEEAVTHVGDMDINGIKEKARDFIAWLTGANIYIQTCIEEMGKPELKSAVQNGTQTSTQLVENALYIFAKVEEIVSALNLGDTLANFLTSNDTNNNAAAAAPEEDSTFPSWVSKKDRKLLQAAAPVAPAAAATTAAVTGATTAAAAAPAAATNATAAPAKSAPAPAPTAPVLPPVNIAGIGTIVPNAVVAQDGSGQFKTIMEAVNLVPIKNTQRFIIYVKAGTYNEVVLMTKKNNVFLVGDGIGKTIITGNQSNSRGFRTSVSATVGVDGDFFMARGITFENTAGPEGHQAVALRINGEKAVIYQCEMKSYQDTLYYHKGLQFYKNCIISGTVDFIFGNGRAIIQDTTIIARLPGPNQANMVTADGGLSDVGQHGLVLQNCKITAEPALMAANTTLIKTYLGRPWKPYAVTMYLENDIGGFIAPEGYSVFALVGPEANNHVNSVYGEYMNTGPGAVTTARDVATFKHWHVLSGAEAQGYTVGKFIDGPAWLPAAGVPFKVGL